MTATALSSESSQCPERRNGALEIGPHAIDLAQQPLTSAGALEIDPQAIDLARAFLHDMC